MTELYKLPNGWEWKNLGELCQFIRGPFGGSLKKQIFKESGNAVYEQSHAIYNQFEKIRYFIDDEKFEEMKRFELRPNSLIMSCSGTIGKVAIVPNNIKKGIINQALLMLTPNSKLNNMFLKLMMESNFFKTLLLENSTGAAIANIASVKILKEIKIPLPSPQEQQRIVSKLDNLFEKIDKSIALHQKNIGEADVFMGSVLNDIFGELEEKYETIDFNSVCNKITDGSHNPPKGIESSNYLMLSSKNIHNNSIHFENPRYLKEEDFIQENKRTDVTIGDVLLTIVGTIGRTAVVNIDKKFTLQRSVAVLKPKKDLLDSYFLMYSLQKNLSVLTSRAKGAAQKGIYLKSIKQLTIVNLPLNIQQKTVTYLDEISQKIEKIKSVQKEKMESLVALKASILDKAFRGEL